jgi:hypothetical protein
VTGGAEPRPEEPEDERGESGDRRHDRGDGRYRWKRPTGRVAPSRRPRSGGRAWRATPGGSWPDGDDDPDGQRDHHRSRLEHGPLFGSVKPTASNSLNSPFAPDPRDHADDRGEHARHERLDDH